MKTKVVIALIVLLLASATYAQANPTKRVAILETVDKESQVPYGVKLMVRSKLCEFITATPGYEGFDRVDVGSILNEHEFQRSGLVSEKDIKRLGEMTGADYVLVAEAAYLNNSYVFLSAKILNVETAKVEQTANVQSPTTVEGLEQNCKNLAGKLLNVNAETGASRGELILSDGKYIGEHKNGKPHGRGIIYFSSEDKRKSYDGDWINGIREGSGTMVWRNGGKYVGKWKSGVRNGYGTHYYANGEIYEGNWLADKQHGKGKITFAYNDSANRKYYDGEWVSNIRQGIGTMMWNDGEWYKGGWRNGKMHGNGELHFSNGNKFVGIYNDNKRHGEGTFYWNDGDRLKAKWVNGVKQGYAVYYWSNGDYEKRNYVDDKREGWASKWFRSGGHESGNYVNDMREGKWEEWDSNMYKTYTKTYKNGKYIKGKIHYR